MTKYGLGEDVLTELVTVFRQHPAVSRVILVGSRAVGTYSPGSDIDLAIDGDQLGFGDVVDLMAALNDLDWLYKIDIINRCTVTEPALLNHIDRVGIPIYERAPVVKRA
ncbi:nucleotidyltransferase domain-containing protein [Spirosoma luteolum]